MNENKSDVLTVAKEVLEIEANSIKASVAAINSAFVGASEAILACQGKIIFSGIGKSGLIARKIASTFSSTGSPSTFLHPAEAAHGDLGIMTTSDLLVAISQSGRSQELQLVFNYAKRLGIPIVFFTGNFKSELAEISDFCIDTSIKQEACPLGLAPTASSSVCLALGDALAMSVLNQRGFTADHFRQLHPAGGLGQRLQRVSDLMHKGDSLPLIDKNATLKEVLILMSRGDVRGACGVTDQQGFLVGIVTDGDLRRRLQLGEMTMSLSVADLMSPRPRTIHGSELAQKALFIMQEFRISVLFVLDVDTKKPIGILHIQDLLKNQVT